MVYYSIMFNDEIEMLYLQLLINHKYVDKFIITEGDKTFSGISKEFNFPKYRHLFASIEQKIIYLQVQHADTPTHIEFENVLPEYVPFTNNWIREKNQREGFLNQMTFDDNDLIFFSDADEIVFLEKALPQINPEKINYLTLPHCVYYVNTTHLPMQFIVNANCCYPYKIYKKYKHLIDKHFNIRKLDHIYNDYHTITDVGYHLAYCYDLTDKLQSFSHGEYNNDACLNHLLNIKQSITEKNVIDIPEIIKQNIPKRFVYPPPMEYFKTIYKHNLWNSNSGTSSGPGFDMQHASPYLTFLSDFVKNKQIESILDVGCGDFNLMKHFNLTGIQYTGIDLVDELIQKNQLKYGKNNITFKATPIHDFTYSGSYDLIICKDVIQHWSIHSVKTFLKNIRNFKYCLLVNDYANSAYENKTHNTSILDSEYTVVDLQKDPYNLTCECVFSWESNGCLKKYMLLSR